MFECYTLPHCDHQRHSMIIIVAVISFSLDGPRQPFPQTKHKDSVIMSTFLDKESSMVAQPVPDHGPAVLTQEAPMGGTIVPQPNIGDKRSWDQQQPELHDAVHQETATSSNSLVTCELAMSVIRGQTSQLQPQQQQQHQ